MLHLQETRASWWCHHQSTCFWSQSVPSFTKMKICFSWTNTRYCVAAVTVFENEGALNDISESAFQFIVRNSCITVRKIERHDACYMVEIRRFKMYNNSFEFSMIRKFPYQDADAIPLKFIVVRSFVCRNYDNILMETGELSDNLRVTEKRL